MKDWNVLYKEKGVIQTEIWQNVVDAVEFLKKQGVKKVLDLGCGTGRHTTYLSELGFEVYGCDVSDEAVNITKEKLPNVKFEVCEMSSLPYEDNLFDAVVCIDVLQHGKVDYIKKTISGMQRVLRKGGILFITVCSTQHPKYSTGEEIEPNTKINTDGLDGDIPHHFFNEKEMNELFNDFQIIKLEHIERTSPLDPGKKSAIWEIYAKKKQS